MRKKIEIKHIISLEDKKAADAQIKECQKQIEYDTKDYTIELLVEKFKKMSSLFQNIKEIIYGETKIRICFWNLYFWGYRYHLCFLQTLMMEDKRS